jgi:hypothetical protein
MPGAMRAPVEMTRRDRRNGAIFTLSRVAPAVGTDAAQRLLPEDHDANGDAAAGVTAAMAPAIARRPSCVRRLPNP